MRITEVIKNGRLVVDKVPDMFREAGVIPAKRVYARQNLDGKCCACLVGALVSLKLKSREPRDWRAAAYPIGPASRRIGVHERYYDGLDDGWSGIAEWYDAEDPEYAAGFCDGQAAAAIVTKTMTFDQGE